jgi:hypothetical protein
LILRLLDLAIGRFTGGFLSRWLDSAGREEIFMRRLLAVAVLAGLAFAAGTGCGSRTVPPPAAPSSPVRASHASDPYAANTHQVCTAVNALVADGVTRFGTDVGAMAGHLSGGNKPEADRSRGAALGRLTELSGRVRDAGQPAADPDLVRAVGAVADRFAALATDPTLLAGVKTVADVPAVNARVAGAAEPLAGVCV